MVTVMKVLQFRIYSTLLFPLNNLFVPKTICLKLKTLFTQDIINYYFVAIGY